MLPKIPRDYLDPFLKKAIAEDLGKGDLTTDALIQPACFGKARIVARQAGVVCGTEIVRRVGALIDRRVQVQPHAQEARQIAPGETIIFLRGPVASILKMERLCLNFLGRLSGISTLTAQFVEKVKPYGTAILDTRKTTPGMRPFEKYAVACGGGKNHRQGLFDQVLIKDNHLWACREKKNSGYAIRPSLSELIKLARLKTKQKVSVEIEVESLADLKDALTGKPDLILLDNMSPAQLKKSVAFVHDYCSKHQILKPFLEASGGITLSNVMKAAATGVDYISVGALTHSAPNFDCSLELLE